MRLPVLNKPVIRGDCLPGGVNEARPCQQASCYWHMAHHEESCVLDVADKGGVTLEEVGSYMGVTRERIRQLENILFNRLKHNSLLALWRD